MRDEPFFVSSPQVGPLDVAIADARMEDERRLTAAVQFGDVAEILKYGRHGSQEKTDRISTDIRFEHDRALEDDVWRETGGYRVGVTGFDSTAEAFHAPDLALLQETFPFEPRRETRGE